MDFSLPLWVNILIILRVTHYFSYFIAVVRISDEFNALG